MANPSRTPVMVRVATDTPLVRAGLERVAAIAGLPVATGAGDYPIQLRAAEEPDAGVGVDVSVGPAAITVTLTALPSPETWDAVFRLLSCLIDSHPLVGTAFVVSR